MHAFRESRARPRRPPVSRVCPTGVRTAETTGGCRRARRAAHPVGAAVGCAARSKWGCYSKVPSRRCQLMRRRGEAR
eukprot:4187159-Alexandrium_andersonii.AAC.1